MCQVFSRGSTCRPSNYSPNVGVRNLWFFNLAPKFYHKFGLIKCANQPRAHLTLTSRSGQVTIPSFKIGTTLVLG